ncbi:hypothetical protein [Reyranella sp. CPCC 100927]|uniref:hypothetical protein n=1 Tax=Reyranella sp. CPCC 100927 TaxID=2599616 RepID=UPI0011B76B08|nr:hypothetical protein [Reyranella sp. CPCC 100927]TWT15390.1 hypothetical protein FQU96_03275 [Reyranella sp. CPCC 100927]
MMRRSFLAVAASAGLSACLTTDDIQHAHPSSGLMAAFEAPYDRVRASTLSILGRLGVTIESVEEFSDGTRILVANGMTGFSWGEVGRVIVERRPTTPIPVRVLWVKRYQRQLTGTSQAEFAQQLYRGISDDLGGF